MGLDWQAQIEQITTDRHSGANQIAQNCALMLLSFTEQRQKPAALDDLHGTLLRITCKILSGQPSMAPVVRVLNDAMLVAKRARDVDEAIGELRRVCQEYVGWVGSTSDYIAKQIQPLISPSATVLTISFSNTVANCLVQVSQSRNVKVICLESRPGLEGRSFAAFLARRNVAVELVVDGAIYESLQEADLWLAGADGLTVSGVINKIGTSAMAITAYALSVPGYILSDTGKLWPDALGLPRIADHDLAEVWKGAPSGIQVRNLYFDLTPWQYIPAIVTEQGLLSPDQVIDMCRSMHVDEEIREFLCKSPESFV